MYNTKLVIEYDGTNYNGFQIQSKTKNQTIQGHLERVIHTLYGEKIKSIICSRTDKGVHAKGQVINFHHSKDKFENYTLIKAMNANLPLDIRVLDAEIVDLNFHSRYHAKGKTYSYLIDNSVAHRPLWMKYSHHIPHPLDVKAMQKASTYLLGTHDFTSFKGRKGVTKSPIRTLYNIDTNAKDRYITFTIEGNGFLYNMVRIIVGTLIIVGRGQLQSHEVYEILKQKDRSFAGPTAPAHGLILEKVYY
ncbi:tRNA pseudouridine(38-40) synthase TruA [Proteinivorax hydrogeniformans]|uniref:tRNA pseudouridine synthase A n=1 Tax=Proteinivorax hydrogeniformans TaxID=1826727 RepID=A0AAU8HU45_9FIRM